MKLRLFALILAGLTTSSLAVAETDLRLLGALQTLQTRVVLPPTRADQAETAGYQVPVTVLAMTSALALATRIPNVPWGVTRLPPDFIIRKAGEASVFAVGVGGAMYLGAKTYKFMRRVRERNLPVEYKDLDGLRRFFDAPLDVQYVLAQRDPLFSNFLIQLAETYTALERGVVPHELQAGVSK